jgi:GNAT superfamily N-acetyltransferase
VIHLDPNRQEEAIAAGWKAYCERVPTYAEAYHRAVAGWSAVAVCDDDKVIGALLLKEGVIHLGIIPEYRGLWASKRVIREMLKYGTRTTMQPDEDLTFIARIGFKQEGTNYVVHR